MIYADPRWEGTTGIGRYAARVGDGLGLAPLPLKGRAGTPLAPFQISRALRGRPDATYFLSMGFTSPITGAVAHSLFIYGLMQRDPGLGFPRYYRAYYDTVVRRGARRADHVFTISEFSREAIGEWLGPGDHSIVNVGAGVEPHFRVLHDVEPDHPFALFVGSMNHNKGFDRLAAAFATLSADDAHLVVVTRSPEDARRLLADAGADLNRCDLRSDIADAELVRLYNTAAVTVVPSRAEGFGLPIAEAGACGSMVICADLPVFREVSLGSVEHFVTVDELADLLRAGGQRPRRDLTERSSAAQPYVDTYRWDDVVARVRHALGEP